jgi:putative membrane protein
MITGICNSDNWGLLGNFDGWGWIGLIVYLVLWVGLVAGLALVVIWALRRARVPAAPIPHDSGQPTAKEILQAQYARGEITREEYEQMRHDLEG